MIVTCDACKTAFTVDDSRISPKGIKVRCSKCKHVFTVRREVPDDLLSQFDDFEKFHRDQIEEAAAEPTEEKPARIPEEPAAISFEEFMSEEEPLPEEGKAEMPGEEPSPLAFEQPEQTPQEETLTGKEIAGQPGEEPAGISFEEFMSEEEPLPEEGKAEMPGEEPSPPAFEQPEQTPQEETLTGKEIAGQSGEEPAAISFEEFMSEEEPLPEEGKAEMPGEEPSPPAFEQPEQIPQEGERSEEVGPDLSLASEPAEVLVAAPEETPTEDEEPQLSVEAFFKGEMARESESQAREAALPSMKDKKLEDLLKEKGLDRRRLRRRSSLRAVLLLILLLTLGGVAYLWWENQGASVSLLTGIGSTLGTAMDKISGLWENVIGSRKGRLEFSGLQGYEEKIGQHRIYIIKGNVTNTSRRARKYVKLRVIILDQAGNRIREKVIFSGNVYTREELGRLSPKLLTGEEILQPKRPKDMVVEPHKTISFMAIFSGLPREGKSFKIEKLEAPGV